MSSHLATDLAFPAVDAESSQTKTKPWLGFGKLPLVLLILFSAIIAVDRLTLPKVAINVDPASYAVVSHELLLGKSLYTDIWDHKPPAIFIVYSMAETAFGYSPDMPVFLDLIISLIILFGVYFAGKAGRGGIVSGLWAAALWVLVSGTFQLEGRDANTEPFLNACLVWAFALMALERKDGLGTKNAIIVGTLFLLGSMFKPVVVAVALFLVLAHIIFSSDRRRAIYDGSVIALVGIAGWVLTFAYFAATARGEIFYQTIIVYNRFYSGNMAANLIAPIHGSEGFLADFMRPLAVFAIIGVIAVFLQHRRQGALLAAFIASSWIAIALPGRFSVHYFQLWLPPLVIGASWAIGSFATKHRPWQKIISYAAGVMLMAFLILNQTMLYEIVVTKKWTPVLPVLKAADATAERLNSLLEPGETFFLWGNTPNLYLLTGRRPPAAIIFDSHLHENPLFDMLAARVKDDLERNRPEILVTENDRAPVPGWISKDYEPIPIYADKGTYSFFIRRGGRLAKLSDASSTNR